MADGHDFERWREIRDVQKKHTDFYKLLGAGALVLLGVFIGRSLIPAQTESFDVNLITEVISIAVTVLILGWFNERQATKRYQQQLIDEAASTSNEVAKHAIHEIRRKGWLEGEDGILKRADLFQANLQDANLRKANLQYASLLVAELQRAYAPDSNFYRADLQGANCEHSDFQVTNLEYTDLRGVIFKHSLLDGANMRHANMYMANLQHAKLFLADLYHTNSSDVDFEHADLRDANFEGVILEGAKFSTDTILPNGAKWTPETDMTQFINPNHPKFWRSRNKSSPAYRAKQQQ